MRVAPRETHRADFRGGTYPEGVGKYAVVRGRRACPFGPGFLDFDPHLIATTILRGRFNDAQHTPDYS